MKILHTADWHIGQLFYQFDRTYEHQQFLNWLINVIDEQKIDVLLVSGDIFDVSNPSAAAIKMLYSFLNRAIKKNASIQIILTAGNHDSASRLESPKPLLESTNIHIIGVIERKQDGTIDYNKLIIPLKNKNGDTEIWCLAIPFLRVGDYPVVAGCTSPYAEGVAALYHQTYEQALAVKQNGQSVIAMGHLHTFNAEISGDDSMERPIMGGVEFIPVSALHEDLSYVALGHIHKAQRIGGREHIRYSGSPVPMSFSEVHYTHQVITFDIEGGIPVNVQPLEVPVSIPFLRVPAKHKPLHEVLQALQELPSARPNPELAPYLEVRILEDGPDPGRRHKVETALTGKHARLASINMQYPSAVSEDGKRVVITHDELHKLKPEDVFNKIYKTRYNTDIPGGILQLFNEVLLEIKVKEE